MVRNIVSGVVGIAVLGVGYFTATGGYEGHDDPTGKFCQETLKLNNAAAKDVEKMDPATTDWTAISSRLQQVAADLEAIDSTDVDYTVMTAGRKLAAAVSAVANETEESRFDAVDAGAKAALENLATVCNNATGEKVTVEK